MRYLSVCSGIEAATVAWHSLGWKAAGFSEIEPFPSAVLQHHYPTVVNLGDMTKYKEWNLGTIDLLVGGTPCQSFSVAGLRKGLQDPRGNLALVYCGILDHFRPQWFVWENVPGVLSSNGGRDFGSFLGALAELGYGFAYRVLDAQYFGVAQRRRRVFVVGYLGDWRPAAEVLFEPESLRRDSPPSREARQETASRTGNGIVGGVDYEGNGHTGSEPTGPLLKGSPTGGGHPLPAIITMAHGQGGAEIAHDRSPTLTCIHEAPIADYGIPGNWIGRKPQNGGNATEPMNDIAPCLTGADRHGVAQPVLAPVAVGTDCYNGAITGDVAATMGTPGSSINASGPTVMQPMAFAQNTRDEVRYINGDGAIAGALAAESGMKQTNYVHQSMAVRRLTPVECERLQGFPDNYTNIPWRKQPESPDGPRYKALGNSMAVPVMAWIGKRIAIKQLQL